MTREEAKQALKNSEPTFLSKAKKSGYICPECNNGAGSDGTGITLYKNGNGLLPHWHCFNCGLHSDIIELWGISRNISGYTERFETLCNYYGIALDSSKSSYNAPKERTANNTTNESKAAQELTEAADFTEYYKECRNALKESKEATSYLQARGISLETALQYWIGFDPKSDPAKCNRPAPRIIMPTCKTHYVGRSIDPQTPKKVVKMNNLNGSPAIFNAKVLQNSEIDAVFVVEGVFDALSIIEAGASAIALSSTNNRNKLLSLLEKEPTKSTLILCFDNDDAGQRCTKELREGLNRLNISNITADICNGYNDPNEALQADREAFKAIVSDTVRLIAKPDNINSYIDKFMMSEIKEFAKTKDRGTGFPELDIKSGGLYSGLYVIGAISGLGKTTFCHQVADQIAESGEEVLFFSLEQSKLELVSKSISRMTAKRELETAVTSLSIRKGYSTREVAEAAQAYKSAVCDRISIIEGNFNCTVSFIGEYVRNYIRRTGKKPIVFIDYLQILQPDGKKQSTKEAVDNTVTELKRLSREQGLTVIVISSVNRANYLTSIDFESFKESGGIEYTADVIWGLQFQCINDDTFNKKDKINQKRELIRKAKAETPRKIELVCLKNRYGVANFSANFNYYPAFDLFQETDIVDELKEEEAPKQRR